MNLLIRTFKNSVWSLMGFVWPLGLFFFSIPYFIMKLGVEQFGIWILVGSTVGILEVLNIGVGDALIKFVSEYRAKNDLEKVNRIISNSLFLYLLISSAVVIAGLVLLPHFVNFFNIPKIYESTVVLVLIIAISGFIIGLFITNILSVFKAFQRYDLSSKTTIAIDTAKILGMMILVYMGHGLMGMVVAHMGSNVMGILLCFIVMNKTLPQVRLKISLDAETMKEIFGFSFFSFLSGISGIIRANIGNIVVGKFLGSSYVPYFSIPFQVSNKLLAGMASLTTVLFPVFSSLKESDNLEKLRQIVIDANKLIVALGFAIGGTLFVFSNAILSLWIGPQFAMIASIPFRILLISFMFTLCATTSYYLLMGFGKMKTIAAMQNLTTFMIVILGILLITKYNIIGISSAYAVGNAALIIYIPYAIKVLWVKNKPNILKAFMPAGMSLFLGWLFFLTAITIEPTTFPRLACYGMLCIIVFLVLTAAIDHDLFKKYLILFSKK